VSEATNPRFHRLIRELERRTGNAVVLNTSMNRRGEPIVCTPTDALNLFFGSDLCYLIMEDLLLTKQQVLPL
jgi:carbamoyltransferase